MQTTARRAFEKVLNTVRYSFRYPQKKEPPRPEAAPHKVRLGIFQGSVKRRSGNSVPSRRHKVFSISEISGNARPLGPWIQFACFAICRRLASPHVASQVHIDLEWVLIAPPNHHGRCAGSIGMSRQRMGTMVIQRHFKDPVRLSHPQAALVCHLYGDSRKTPCVLFKPTANKAKIRLLIKVNRP